MNKETLEQIKSKFPSYLRVLEHTKELTYLREKYQYLDDLLETEAMCHIHRNFDSEELPEWFEEWVKLRCDLARVYKKADAKFPKTIH